MNSYDDDIILEEEEEAQNELLDNENDNENKNKKKKLTVVEAAKDDYFSSKLLDGYVEDDGEENIVKLNNIHKTYLLGIEGVPALRGISLSIKKGEFVCIYGTSGGGKTSLLNIIGTIDKPTKGELFINGTRITYNTPDRVLANLRLKELGFVFQTFNLLSSLTAIENVEMPMILEGRLSNAERKRRALDALTQVGMDKRTDHLPSQLSGGEQQRVTIARAIANEPSLLLLDEPTGDLDTVNTAIVMKLLTDLNKKGISLIMVTHDVGLKYFADRIIWLRDGKIQRIEYVSDEKKQESYSKLDQELEDLGLSEKYADHENDDHGKKSDNKNKLFQNIAIRMPHDYRTHKDYDKDTAKKLSTFTTNVNKNHSHNNNNNNNNNNHEVEIEIIN
eukprot:TRINITY_DN1158_c2_g1_i1.p1 TRINITY_DN1158_c2_g1~~TRINITY_DN1158_c2_g1_i1.p1  ORF type:complete len:391 (+),score=152.28 TRINITY_DN1158_c2_g1_i1:108-1280(+)